MICLWCQANIEESSVFCENCGKRIPRCPTCGKVVEEGTRFCDEDGTPIPQEVLALFATDATVRVRPAPPEEAPPVQPEPTQYVPPVQPEYEPTEYVPPVQPEYEPTQYVPPVQPEYQPAPKKSSGNGLAIFLVVLLAILVVVGGYFLWTEYLSEDEEEDSERTSSRGENEEESEEEGPGENNGTGSGTAATVPNAADPTESTTPVVQEPVVTYEYRYEVISSDMSWTDANAVCQSKGGYLATIDSPEEYETICAMLEEYNSRQPDGRKLVYVWLGSYLAPNSTQWKWSTGEAIPMQNYYWYKNEPSYEDNGVRENCLCLWDLSYNGYDWTLNDQRNDLIQDFPNLSGKLGYICEYKIEVRK